MQEKSKKSYKKRKKSAKYLLFCKILRNFVLVLDKNLIHDYQITWIMDILNAMYARAKSNPQRIVLPEGDEPRTLEAADIILEQGLATGGTNARIEQVEDTMKPIAEGHSLSYCPMWIYFFRGTIALGLSDSPSEYL